MLQSGPTGKLLAVIGAILLACMAIAGGLRSLWTQQRLPEINLIVTGPQDHIDALITRKDYASAIGQLQMQARLQPSNSAAHEHLGSLLALQGRTTEARAAFQQLVRLRPDYADGHNFLGATHLNLGQFALAARSFEQAILLKPEFPQAYNGLGVTRIQQGDLAEAEQCFARAVELLPSYGEARANLERVRRDAKLRR